MTTINTTAARKLTDRWQSATQLHIPAPTLTRLVRLLIAERRASTTCYLYRRRMEERI
jgi:histone H3/H4